jgi:predicted NBD/HSP70 family sugar kinase
MTDYSGDVCGDVSIALPARPERGIVLAGMIDAIQTLTGDGRRDPDSLRGIGLGLPGLVDRDSGTALSYRPIRRWKDVPVRDILEGALGVPVSVEHNSNTMALGEACLGDAADFDHVVSVLIRTGVSIGEAQHRDICRHSPVGAGELGHTVVNVRGPACWCGTRGCLEAYASGWALQKRLRRYLRTHEQWTGRQAFSDDGSLDATALCRLAMEGDAKAEASIREVFHYLGIGINTVVRLLAPDAVIINGPFNVAAPIIREEILAVLQRPLEHPLRLPDVIVSQQDDRIGAVGAALMAASHYCNPIHRVPM